MCFLYTATNIYSGLFMFIAGASAASTAEDSDDDPGQVVQDLVSDLGPLLALFGERFASQFMSEAISWVDCMVFALAPLGIITMIVAAVRVGGPPWLKTLLGRARETFAIAEMDTMSSTSHEVCECWNGKSIVRVMGQPQMLELLFFEQEYTKEETTERENKEKEKRGQPTSRPVRRFGLHTIDEALQHDHDRAKSPKPSATRGRPPLVKRVLSEKRVYQITDSGSSSKHEPKWSATVCSIMGMLGRFKNTNSNKDSKMEEGQGPSGAGTATEPAKHPQRRHSTFVNDKTLQSRAPNRPRDISPGQGPSLTGTATESAKHQPRRTSTFVNDETPRPRAPNMSLNISPDRQRMDIERNFAALLGFASQFILLAFTALLAYHEPWRGEGFLGASRKSKAYAFPLTAVGTMAVSYGLYLCTRVVERASLETSWSYGPEDKDVEISGADAKFRCMWLQGQGTVNDQTFDSHVVICRGKRAAIFTSQRSNRLLSSVDISNNQETLQESATSPVRVDSKRNPKITGEKHYTSGGLLTMIGVDLKKQLEVQAVIGSFVTIFGFISQFIGIRGSHYLVAILNLVATIAMTGARAYLRRSLSIHPYSQKIWPQYELDWVALNFVNDPLGIWPEAIQSNSPAVKIPREEKQNHTGRGSDGATTNELSVTRFRREIEKFRSRFSGATPVPRAKSPPNFRQDASGNLDPPAQSTAPARIISTQKSAEIETPFLEMRSVIVHSVVADTKRINDGKAQQVVQVRQRLRALAQNWDTPATNYARSVAMAIQESMHRLLPQGSPVQELTWDIPCTWKENKNSAITITLNKAPLAHDIWEADPHLIEAVLSLWMFQIEAQKTQSVQDSKPSTKESEWYQKDTHIRVLSKHSEGLHAALQWWVEKDGIARVETRALEESRLDSGFMPSQDTSKSRVVGVVDSTAGKYSPFGDQASPSSARKITKKGNTKTSTEYLVAPTNIPTIQLMAQHIFTSFMWSLVPLIQPIQADVARPQAGEKVPQKPEVRSHLLDQLIDTISRSTDLGTADDLYLCIIPALSLGKKLSEADCVIHHAHLRATAEYDSRTEWTKSGKIYKDLFSTARRFGPQSQIGIQATVVLTDFFTFLTMKLEQTELAESDAQFIKDIQKSISEELRWADKDVFLELIAINSKLKIRSIDLALKKIEEKTEKTIAEDKGSKGRFGRNVYHIAARENRLEGLISESEKPSSVNGPASASAVLALLDQKDDFNRTPLHYYILFGHENPNLKNGDATTRSESQKPALSKETQRTQHEPVKTLKWLCKEGAKLQSADNNKCTALHYAVTSYALEAPVRALFELMANQGMKDVKDRYGRTPLHHSAERGSLGITKLLLSFGADKSCVNNFGMLPLHAVALRRETSEHEGTDLSRILDLLKVDHSWISRTDRFGRTPLVLALQSGRSWGVNHLLTNVDALDASSDNKGWGPLHHAAWRGTDPVLVAKMHKAFQKINPLPPTLELSYKSRDGRTPGHIAVVRNRTALISHLFDRATLLLRDADENSAIDLAITQDNFPVIEALDALDKKMRTENQTVNAKSEVVTAPTIRSTPPGSLLEIEDPAGRLPIDLAAHLGKLKALECLIKLGGNPNGSHRDTAAHLPGKEPDCCLKISSCGETPLHYAAQSGNAAAIKLLRTQGAAIETKDKRGGTPLFRAAYQEHANCIDALLEKLGKNPTADPNSKDHDGNPALLVSFGYSTNIDATRALLRSDSIDVNARDSGDRTILYLAVRESQADLVDAILESKRSGVELEIEPGSQKTVLDLAMEEGNKDIADKIIAYRKVDNMDDDQFLPQQLLRMVTSRQVDRVRELIAMKAELADGAVNRQGENALHIAVKNEDVEIVRLLLDLKDTAGFFGRASTNGETALHRACNNEGNTILEALLDKKAPLTPQNSYGETVLHLAVSTGNLQRVRILLRYAYDQDTLEKHKLLEVKNNAHNSALWTALSEYNLPIARALMESGADPCTTNRSGLTIWHTHSKRGQSTILQFMKFLSAENLKKVNEAGEGLYHGTPLQTAVLAGEAEFVRKFCRLGAGLDIEDAHGWSPRLCIRFSEDPDIRSLVENSGGKISDAEATFEHLKANPSSWSTACKPDFILLDDAGLTVRSCYNDSANLGRDPTGYFGVQANCPFAPSGPRYFEIKVIETGFEECLALGVCNGREEFSGMVGWRGTSWGYHGDDGMVYHDSTYGMPDLQYPTFGEGDTVGCGLDKRNRIFFTMNGTKVGTPFESVIGQLFPVVRMSHGFKISTSFGDQFKYRLTDEDISFPADLKEILREKMARFQQLKEDWRIADGEDDSSEESMSSEYMHSIHQSDGGTVVSHTSPSDTPAGSGGPAEE